MAVSQQQPKVAEKEKNKEPELRINQEIDAEHVRLVGDNIDVPNQVVQTYVAIRMAEEMELDLVEISPKADPPVCKIIDYQKYLYQLKRKQKEMKAKSVKTVVKEIRFGPQTDEHDYNFKLKHAISFLNEGAKIKAYVFFKGRSIIYKEQGEELLARFTKDLEDLARVDQTPKLEGKRMTMFLSAKSKK